MELLLLFLDCFLGFLVKVKKSGGPYFLITNEGDTDLESDCFAQPGLLDSDIGGGIGLCG